MTNRPTPEQIAVEVLDFLGMGIDADYIAGVIRQKQQEHGYVIVHPDDVPSADEASGDAFQLDWDDCRHHIFGDTP